MAGISIPIGLSVIFLTEQSFSGIAAVMLFLAAVLISLMSVDKPRAMIDAISEENMAPCRAASHD